MMTVGDPNQSRGGEEGAVTRGSFFSSPSQKEAHKTSGEIKRLRRKHQTLSHQLMMSLRTNSRASSKIQKQLKKVNQKLVKLNEREAENSVVAVVNSMEYQMTRQRNSVTRVSTRPHSAYGRMTLRKSPTKITVKETYEPILTVSRGRNMSTSKMISSSASPQKWHSHLGGAKYIHIFFHKDAWQFSHANRKLSR